MLEGGNLLLHVCGVGLQLAAGLVFLAVLFILAAVLLLLQMDLIGALI